MVYILSCRRGEVAWESYEMVGSTGGSGFRWRRSYDSDKPFRSFVYNV